MAAEVQGGVQEFDSIDSRRGGPSPVRVISRTVHERVKPPRARPETRVEHYSSMTADGANTEPTGTVPVMERSPMSRSNPPSHRAPSRRVRRIGIAVGAALLAIAVPVAMMEPAADAAQVTAAGFTTSGTAKPAPATVGQDVAVSLSVRSAAAQSVLIDIEVYDRSGRKVFQRAWDTQQFTAGQTRSFSASWPTRGVAAGTYTVRAGVFRAGWTGLIHWNDQATTISLGRATTTTTTTTTTPTTTTPTTTAAPTTTRPPTTTTTTTTTTTPPGGRFATLPVGAALPSGADCATRVRSATEIRPENSAANATLGTRANANNRTDWSGFDRVDGAFSGTTDQIIQWAACKWGIDEDIVRAQVLKESYWYMSAVGDAGESFGLGQVRTTAHQSAFEYAAVNARNSSAYNLDYTYASWRACYEGAYNWLNTVEHNGTYAAGDVWGCVGVWFSGRWYVGTDAYLDQPGDSVRWHYNSKTWLTPTFVNG